MFKKKYGRATQWNIIQPQKVKYWCYNVDEPWKHYAKWNKPDTKGHTVYDPIYMKCQEYANLWRQKVDLSLPGERYRMTNRIWIAGDWLCWLRIMPFRQSTSSLMVLEDSAYITEEKKKTTTGMKREKRMTFLFKHVPAPSSLNNQGSLNHFPTQRPLGRRDGKSLLQG